MSIREIAKRSGFSTATVSNALNQKKNVSEETRELIVRIADELNYVPNSLARGLLAKMTNIIGLIVPDLSMPYTLEIMRHLEYYARENELYLLIGHTDGKPDTMRSIAESFIKKNVDAIILATGLVSTDEEGTRELLSGIRKFNIFSVVITPSLTLSSPGTNFVVPDLEDGALQLMRHLLDRGHRSFLYVGGFETDYVTELRRRGFVQALQQRGIEAGPALFRDCGYTFQDGYRESVRLLSEGAELPSAIMAINDSVAMGVFKGLREHGIRVPEEVSLVGYDDIKLPSMDFVPLTTVRIPVNEMSKLCIEGLIKYRAGNKHVFQYTLQPQLIIRESVRTWGAGLMAEGEYG